METRANYIAVGLFVLLVLVGALGFVYWLYRSLDAGATAQLRIVFPEPVTGLSRGSSVLFNGIRIGEVTELGFVGHGDTRVVATTMVSRTAPIKTDTSAELGFQGLTGVAYVSMTGGSDTAPLLFADTDEEVPQILAKTSAYQDLMEGARDVLAKVDTTLTEVNQIIADNRENLDTTIANVRTFSEALSESAPQISQLIDDVSGAGRALADAGPGITRLVERATEILAEVEPAEVREMVENVTTFTRSLGGIGESIDTVVADVRGAVANVEEFTTGLNATLADVRAVVDAVDPERVAGIVGNVEAVTGELAARRETIGELIANASEAAGSVNRVAENLAGRNEQIAAIIDNTQSITAEVQGFTSRLEPAVESFTTALDAIDPEAVRTIVANVRDFTGTINGQSDQITALIANAGEAAGNINRVAENIAGRNEQIATIIDNATEFSTGAADFGAQLPDLIEEVRPGVENLAAALNRIDPAAVEAIVSNVRSVTDTVVARRPAIDALIADARATATNARTLTQALTARTGDIGTIVDNATAASEGVRSFAAELPGLAERVRPGLENLGTALSRIKPDDVERIVANVAGVTDGLATRMPEVEALIADARVTAANVREVTDTLAARRADIDTVIGNVTTVSDRLVAIADEVQPALSSAAEVLRSIEPAEVETIVANVRGFTDTLAAQNEAIEATISDARATAANVREVSDTVAARRADIDTIIANARDFSGRLDTLAESAAPAVDAFREVLAAIDPADVRGIAAGIRDTVAAIAERREQITAAIDNVEAASASARSFGETVAGQNQRIEEIVATAQRVADNLDAASARVNGVVERVGEIVDGPAGNFFVEAAAAARSINVVASAFAGRADSIANGINRFVNAGGNDVRALINEARGTLSQINRAVNSLESNPSRILTGGPSGPRYSPQRR